MSNKQGHEEKERDAAVMLQGYSAGMANGPVVDVAKQPAARPLAPPAAHCTAKHLAAQQPVNVAKQPAAKHPADADRPRAGGQQHKRTEVAVAISQAGNLGVKL